VKPPPFSYERPESVAEAVQLLAQHGEGAKLLAGGQSLMPMLNLRLARPTHLIDLNFVEELVGVHVETRQATSTLVVSAMTRQRALERNEDASRHCPLVVEALGHVGHFQTRNRGTVGGSIAHADPAAELVCVATALDATVVLRGPVGERRVPFDAFPQGPLMTDVAESEVITALELPTASGRSGHAFVEFARRHGDFALAAAAVVLEADERDHGVVVSARVALIGAGSVPVRARATEAALVRREVAEIACSKTGLDAHDDVVARADAYQRHLLDHLASQAVRSAASRLSDSHVGVVVS
jgi:carbon-monoxide dehydrogenase medium subunit